MLTSKANIIVTVERADFIERPNAVHDLLAQHAIAGLEGRVMRWHGTQPLVTIKKVNEVWVGLPGGGPFPTMKQGDAVKELREEYGREDRLLFSPNAYEGTHLAAYGLIEMTWAHGARRLMIRPNGERVFFESVSI